MKIRLLLMAVLMWKLGMILLVVVEVRIGLADLVVVADNCYYYYCCSLPLIYAHLNVAADYSRYNYS